MVPRAAGFHGHDLAVASEAFDVLSIDGFRFRTDADARAGRGVEDGGGGAARTGATAEESPSGTTAEEDRASAAPAIDR